MLRAVIHVDETGKWPVAAANVANLLRDAGENGVQAAKVANGEAVGAFRPGGRSCDGAGTVPHAADAAPRGMKKGFQLHCRILPCAL